MNEHKPIVPAAAGYGEDFYAWSREQAERIRASRPRAIDWENVAEEIEGLGRSDRRRIASDLKVILEHLIKWRYQPEKRKAGWRSTIREHRDRIERIIADSPSLARVPQDTLEAEYRKARAAAIEDTRLPEARVPEICPFGIEDVLDPGFWPERDRR
jgi:hypothetical protein